MPDSKSEMKKICTVFCKHMIRVNSIEKGGPARRLFGGARGVSARPWWPGIIIRLNTVQPVLIKNWICPTSFPSQARPHDTMAARHLATILRKVNPENLTAEKLFSGIRAVDALTHFCDHILALVRIWFSYDTMKDAWNKVIHSIFDRFFLSFHYLASCMSLDMCSFSSVWGSE